ncbi:MAG: hypothetical protein ACPG51_20755 [Thiolinea sp.]
MNALQPDTTLPVISTGACFRFVLKIFAYSAFLLLVVFDGLSNAESFNTRLLTLPYFIGGLCLTRSICEALEYHYDGHAALFAMGLSTLSAMA